MVNNRLYRVAGVGNDYFCVVPVDEGSETSLNIPSDHANDLVDKYNLWSNIFLVICFNVC